jgi:hypothetical protein
MGARCLCPELNEDPLIAKDAMKGHSPKDYGGHLRLMSGHLPPSIQ